MDEMKTFAPMATFRWFVSGDQKVLQQMWLGNGGEQRWQEIEVVIDKTWDGHITDRRPV